MSAKTCLILGLVLTALSPAIFIAFVYIVVIFPENPVAKFLGAFPESAIFPEGVVTILLAIFFVGLLLTVTGIIRLIARRIQTGKLGARLLTAGITLLALSVGGTALLCVSMGGTGGNFGFFMEFMAMSGLILIPLAGLLLGVTLTLSGLIALAAGAMRKQP